MRRLKERLYSRVSRTPTEPSSSQGQRRQRRQRRLSSGSTASVASSGISFATTESLRRYYLRSTQLPENDSILENLDEDYFKTIDAKELMANEMSKFEFNLDQNQLETRVEELREAEEVVSAHLSSHVLSNHEQFVEGIKNVGSVQELLSGAYQLCQDTRSNMATASIEYGNNLKVSELAKSKRLLVLMQDVMERMQELLFISQEFNECRENNNFSMAVGVLQRGIQLVEELNQRTLQMGRGKSQLALLDDLRGSFRRQHLELQVQLDTALLASCNNFQHHDFENILGGYFQLHERADLGNKIFNSFVNAIKNSVTNMLRSVLITQSKAIEQDLVDNQIEVTFQDLCNIIPHHHFRTSLARVLEILFDIMVSYHCMLQWHKWAISENELTLQGLDNLYTQALQEYQKKHPEHSKYAGLPQGVELWESSSEIKSVSYDRMTVGEWAETRENTINWGKMLASIQTSMEEHQMSVWDIIQSRIKDMLSAPSAFEGEHFLVVMEWLQRFITAGEAFSGKQAEKLRNTIESQCGKFFESYHRNNIEALEGYLLAENWKGVQIDLEGSEKDHSLAHSLRSPKSLSGNGGDNPRDFADWIRGGNPFRRDGFLRKVEMARYLRLGFGGTTSKYEQEAGSQKLVEVDSAGVAVTGDSMMSSRRTTATTFNDDDDEPEEVQGDYIDDDGQVVKIKNANGNLNTNDNQEDSQVMTMVGIQMLRFISNYGAMLRFMSNYGEMVRVLSSNSWLIFQGIAELFEMYMAHVFMLFSGISVEMLVDEKAISDMVGLRLRTTILRILEGPNSKYRGAVQQAQLQQQQKQGQQQTIGNAVVTSGGVQLSKALRFGSSSLRSIVGRGPNTGNGVDSSLQISSNNLFGLHERVVAIESLTTLASQLRQARPELETWLPPSKSRELDNFFKRSVDCTSDVRVCLFNVATYLLLSDMYDQNTGIATRIADTNYNTQESPTEHSEWVEDMQAIYEAFNYRITTANIPKKGVLQMWQQAINLGDKVMLEGFTKVGKACSGHGRDLMNYDQSTVASKLRSLIPAQEDGLYVVIPNFPNCQFFVQGYYIAWDDLTKYLMTHSASLGRERIDVLIEIVGIKERKQVKEIKYKKQEIGEFLSRMQIDG